MKILHITDLHFTKHYFEWLSEQQSQYDAIFLTGDLINDHQDASESFEQQVSWIENWAKTLTTPLFICSGNHDENPDQHLNQSLEELFSLDDDCSGDSYSQEYDLVESPTETWIQRLRSKTVFTDGQITDFHGKKIGCIPYSCTDFHRFADCDLILTHVPPANTKTARYQDYEDGDTALKDAIVNKVLSCEWIFCGHVHRPIKTLDQLGDVNISNPGSRRGLEQPLSFSIEL